MNVLHSKYSTKFLRTAYGSSAILSKKLFMYPIFISHDPNGWESISAMPGQYRIGVNKIVDFLKTPVKNGLAAVLIFGTIDNKHKDALGSACENPEINPVHSAIKIIRENFAELFIACDVCLCAYTSHGHCGVLFENGKINNKASIARLADVSVAYAKSGCDCVAPSDMMDSRVAAIKESLLAADLAHITIMAYSSKFASGLYGPFREAAGSAPSFGDRSCYQLPITSKELALQAAHRDSREGADVIMVKPGTLYLDIVNQIHSELPHHCVAVYHVSGEYAMLIHAINAGVVDRKKILIETMTAFRRAGASIIITYFTPDLLEMDLNSF